MKEIIREVVRAALHRAGLPDTNEIILERPRSAGHGDWTTTIALTLAKAARQKPRDLAGTIAAHLQPDPELIAKVEVAGPGFINFTMAEGFFRTRVKEIIAAGPEFGRTTSGQGKKVQVEFVSANPTGPLTVGHGRGAVYGDTVARLLEWTGHHVTREYYFNNAGRQMRILGDSVRLRYLELLGDPVTFPDDYYQGEYIREIASHLRDRHGDTLRGEPAEGRFKDQAEEEIFADIRKTLGSLGIEFASYFNEYSLYTDGKITAVIDDLRSRGLVYEQDGAVWFKVSALGNEKDKVIVKSTGEPTYRLPDIAYHRTKYARGYDLMIDIFGADHVATYPDVVAALKALGYDTDTLKVLIHQFVTITQAGEVVKMSTRKANFITLDELIAEVGADVVRYFFLMRTIASHLNFDLAIAKKQSDENPVYYLQYAHARICSILRYAAEAGTTPGGADPALLVHPAELELLRSLVQLPDVIEACSSNHEPHHLADYLHVTATLFHKFYHECRVVTDDKPLTRARLALCEATKIVLANGFAVLGITAPEQM